MAPRSLDGARTARRFVNHFKMDYRQADAFAIMRPSVCHRPFIRRPAPTCVPARLPPPQPGESRS
ncbi:hypothetical protein FOB31_19115 [Burkholderia multivorans]|nr:hypothetical protein FOB31_19115 [Burkholderia multivorans]QET40822.1 hypothetical protein FOB30_24745 [Burkholderia multivorans]